MAINYALRNLYQEVLKEGLKVRVVRGPILGPLVKYVYELETYTEKGFWFFKTRLPRHRYYLYSNGAMVLRSYLP